MKTLVLVFVAISVAIPALGAHIVLVDVDPAIPELTDLSQARWMRYNLGPDDYMWRVFMDADENGIPDVDHAEVRFSGSVMSAQGDSILFDGYPTLVPMGVLLDGRLTQFNLAGTASAIDCLLDYLALLEFLDFPTKTYLDVDRVGVKTFYMNGDSLSGDEQGVLEQEISAYNDPALWGATTEVVVYSGMLPVGYEQGNESTWLIRVVDSLEGPGGTVDAPNTTVYIARDSPGDFQMIVREEIASAVMSGGLFLPETLEIYSLGYSELQLADKMAARVRHFSAISGSANGGPDDQIHLQYLFAPNWDNGLADYPENIPDSPPVAMGWLDANGTFVDDVTVTGTDAPPARTPALRQNTPNPFNPTTTIAYTTSLEGYVSMKIYDIAGRYVATLVDESMPAGDYTAVWNGTDASGAPVSSGTYVYELVSGDHRETRKMVLVR